MASPSLNEHVTFHSAPIFASDPLRPMSHCATLAELPEGGLLAAFPNPNSGIDLIRLRNGHLVLAFNDSPRCRTPLRIALSQDEGCTWACVRTLEDGDGEFSYPALLQTRDGLVHCVYTYRRETIRHAQFSEQWLMAEN
jgi:predicted neuraminidase